MRLVFMHGWGFDAGLWDRLRALLPLPTICLEGGYFLQKTETRYQPESDDILVGHSHGLHQGFRLRQDWQAWIAINSFTSFTLSQAQGGCGQRLALQSMRRAFAADPVGVLAKFYLRCGVKADFVAQDLNLPQLQAGLEDLAISDLGEILSKMPSAGLVLATEQDPLAPLAAAEALTRNSNAPRRLEVHNSASHCLPLTAPEWCAQQIQEFLLQDALR
jgi:pimeloyl-ACP methyl ester carboxylesterase